jgi:hypothetical protein
MLEPHSDEPLKASAHLHTTARTTTSPPLHARNTCTIAHLHAMAPRRVPSQHTCAWRQDPRGHWICHSITGSGHRSVRFVTGRGGCHHSEAPREDRNGGTCSPNTVRKVSLPLSSRPRGLPVARSSGSEASRGGDLGAGSAGRSRRPRARATHGLEPFGLVLCVEH